MSKHTQGPWEVVFGNVSDADEGFGIASKIDTGRGVVCECWPCVTDLALRQRLRADARLIAAAPDLLAACKGIDQAIDALRHDFGTQYPALAAAWFNVRNAIARAEAPQ